MGLGSTVSTILLEFKGDTKQARSELKKLSKEQRATARAQIEATKKQNDAIDSQIAFLGKAAFAIGTVGTAFAALNAASKVNAERAQLQFAAGSTNIERLKDATRGLITETELLATAAALQNGAFKVSQREMEIAGRAMVSLRNQGNDFAEVQREVTRALVEGNTEGLKKFGINVKASTGTAEAFTAVMQALAVEAKKTAASVDLAGDSAERARVGFRDFWDEVVNGAGKGANAVVKFLADVRDMEDNVADAHSRIFKLRRERIAREQAERRAATVAYMREHENEIYVFTQNLFEVFAPALDSIPVATGFVERFSASMAGAEAATRKAYDATVQFTELEGRIVRPQGFTRAPERGAIAGVGDVAAPSDAGAALRGLEKGFNPATPELTKAAEALPVSDALMSVVDTAGLASTAMSTFQSSGVNAFQAWITGASSLGDALKSAVADGLLSLSLDMFSRSLFHAANAVGQLALGNAPGAAASAKAAGLFAAGAVVVGATASALGAGGSGGRSAVGSSGSLPAGAAAAVTGPSSLDQTFIVASSPFDDDPRAARRRMQRAFDRARLERGNGTAVVNV